MNSLIILVIFSCTIALILISVVIRNRKDKKAFVKSLDAAEDEETLRSIKRPGERERNLKTLQVLFT